MDTIFVVFAALVGLIIGSFLNCLVWRLYSNETLGGRSHCPRCQKMIAWFDNIPILSFLLLRGRCRSCHEKISWQYPLIEAATALFFALSFWQHAGDPLFGWLLARDWFMISILIVVFIYDLRWMLVPMTLIWLSMPVVIGINLLLGFAWWEIAITGIFGATFFLIQYLATSKRGLGEGDIWLGLLLGLTFPQLSQLITALILAYSSGSITALTLLAVGGKNWKSKIALGPFLAFGAIITLIYGQEIIAWYLGLI